jgi:nucleotide-binding universal stress UspA family protein
MKTILAPIDFSESSKLVIAEAVALARAMDARVVLLHVIPPRPEIPSEFSLRKVTAKVAGAAVYDAVQRLSHIQRQLAEREITVTTFHVSGIPSAAIVELAEEFQASYIVIGSHGHGELYDLIIGSTASSVLKEATCPVVVVPSHAAPLMDALCIDFEPAGGPALTDTLLSPVQR